MKPDSTLFTDHFFAARGLDGKSPALQIDRQLSPGYPLCLYRFQDGRRLLTLCEELEDAMPALQELGSLPDFVDVWDYLFEGSLSFEAESVSGFYLPAVPDGWALGPFRPLKRGDGLALSDLKRLDPAGFALAAVRVRDLGAVGLFGENGQLLAAAGAQGFGPFGDISVLVQPDARGQGLGTAAVKALCVRLKELGLIPLYRAEDTNLASCALARGLGFLQGYAMDGGRTII